MNMAKSKYEYVREFESATDHRLLLDSFIVVRVDGQCFHQFSKEHNFLKPNDKRCLDLMNRSALHVMKSFYPNIIMAYGQSDEYSFVLKRLANLFNRRQNKITSLITSTFTAAFIFHWDEYFSNSKNTKLVPLVPEDMKKDAISLDQTMKYPASFDGRCVLYPNELTLMDYLKWRQVDCHINNLYNTTFYALTGEYTKYNHLEVDRFSILFPYRGPKSLPNYSPTEATKKLAGSSSGDKNEILFTDYGINYNNELEQFRKGTIITLNLETSIVQELLIKNKSNKQNKQKNKIEEYSRMNEVSDQELFEMMNIDIISERFWQKYGHLMKL